MSRDTLITKLRIAFRDRQFDTNGDIDEEARLFLEAATRIERMEMALRDAQRQFLFYERNHRAKVGDMATIVETQQTIEKAETNATMAKICGDVLSGAAPHPAILALVDAVELLENISGDLELSNEAASRIEKAKIVAGAYR